MKSWRIPPTGILSPFPSRGETVKGKGKEKGGKKKPPDVTRDPGVCLITCDTYTMASYSALLYESKGTNPVRNECTPKAENSCPGLLSSLTSSALSYLKGSIKNAHPIKPYHNNRWLSLEA